MDNLFQFLAKVLGITALHDRQYTVNRGEIVGGEGSASYTSEFQKGKEQANAFVQK